MPILPALPVGWRGGVPMHGDAHFTGRATALSQARARRDDAIPPCTVNFDDQDWEHGLAPGEDSRGPSAVWKVALGVAVGIVIGAALMYGLDRQVPPWTLSDMAPALQQLMRGTGQASQTEAGTAKRPLVPKDAAPALQDQPARPANVAPLPVVPAPSATPGRADSRGEPTPTDSQRDRERRERAWARFYNKPPHCADNPTAETMVECANHYIRARREFEQAYAAGKL